jgi:hypothetical protein
MGFQLLCAYLFWTPLLVELELETPRLCRTPLPSVISARRRRIGVPNFRSASRALSLPPRLVSVLFVKTVLYTYSGDSYSRDSRQITFYQPQIGKAALGALVGSFLELVTDCTNRMWRLRNKSEL